MANNTAEELTGQLVSLDGRTAIVMGRWEPFASITTIESPFISADFAWKTIDRIIKRDGKFRT